MSTLVNSVFSHCALPYTCFNASTLSQVTFNACQLVGTNFFSVKIFNSILKNSDLTDCLLLDAKNKFQISHCTPHRMTKPVIALAWNFKAAGDFASMTAIALKNSQSIPLKFDYEPSDIHISSLHNEVQFHLEQIRQERLTPSLSIADEIITRASKESEIIRIHAKSKEILSYAHGLILPGGGDIELEFYDLNPSIGIKKNRFTYTTVEKYDNYCRSIFEFTLIREAKNRETPTIGICRGSQIVNVYQGGTLTNHVDNHFSIAHNLHIVENLPEKPREIIQTILKIDRITGISMHHQANKKIGQGLTVVLKADDVPEALVTHDGNFILTQFHPEYYYYLQENLLKIKKTIAGSERGAKKYAILEEFISLPEVANNQNFFTYLVDKAHQKQIENIV
jgi:putative glutamine amidotransferase